MECVPEEERTSRHGHRRKDRGHRASERSLCRYTEADTGAEETICTQTTAHTGDNNDGLTDALLTQMFFYVTITLKSDVVLLSNVMVLSWTITSAGQIGYKIKETQTH